MVHLWTFRCFVRALPDPRNVVYSLKCRTPASFTHLASLPHYENDCPNSLPLTAHPRPGFGCGATTLQLDVWGVIDLGGCWHHWSHLCALECHFKCPALLLGRSREAFAFPPPNSGVLWATAWWCVHCNAASSQQHRTSILMMTDRRLLWLHQSLFVNNCMLWWPTRKLSSENLNFFFFLDIQCMLFLVLCLVKGGQEWYRQIGPLFILVVLPSPNHYIERLYFLFVIILTALPRLLSPQVGRSGWVHCI